jgi:maltodextrin utilization protein YvdJ
MTLRHLLLYAAVSSLWLVVFIIIQLSSFFAMRTKKSRHRAVRR